MLPFVGLAPLKLKFLSKEIKGGYVYIEESFDTIFNMGYGSENRQWTKGVGPGSKGSYQDSIVDTTSIQDRILILEIT